MTPKGTAEQEAITALAAEIEPAIHRTICGGAKHRSKWTGICSSSRAVAAAIIRERASKPGAGS